MRSAEIASHFASQTDATPCFPKRKRVCSLPVPATRPVLVTGAIPEEPAVTRVVAAGSVVSCGSVLPDADACGVAFHVAMDAQFTSHSVGLPCPRPHQSKGSAQQSFSLGQRLPHALGVEPFDLQHLRRRGVAADDGDRS